jgi:hypothetical protein
MQALDPAGIRDAEDDACDHLEGERAHAGAHREPLADPPPRDLGLGDLTDHRAAVVHRGALERR